MHERLTDEIRQYVETLVARSIVINVHPSSQEIAERLCRIERMLGRLLNMEVEQMAIGQDVLDKVTAQATTIDSIKTLLNAWVSDNTITAAQRDAINAAFAANSSKLGEIETALQPAA